MFDSETLVDSAPVAAEAPAEVNAESLLSAEMAETPLLSRSEEEILARQIVRARTRVRAVLRRARGLVRRALADGGRGVIRPERGFREREALAILRFARNALRRPGGFRATGMDRSALQTFIRDLQAALGEYRLVRDRMVRANVRLVAMLARRYRHPTLSFLDLFQEGTLGLLRAVEKYEPARQVKFSTYASWWIWQQLGRAADTQGALIRTPVHWNQLRRRVGRSQDGADAADALPADDSVEADSLRFDAMTRGFRYVSMDTPTDDDERPLESMLADPDAGPEEQAFHTGLSEHLESAVAQLPAREGFIVRQRFGLGADPSQTLEEISRQLGVSRERVRQLENRALIKLREVCAAQGLREYLN